MIHPSVAVLEHHLTSYRRVWRGSVFSSFLLPVLFLLAMGFSVGGYVDEGGALGVPYLDYIAPGLLASTALQVAVNESTWPAFAGFTWTRTYHSMSASPLRVGDILAGTLAYILVRSAAAAAAFLAVMTVFGAVHSVAGVAALPACVLVAAAMAAPTLAYSATIGNDGMFALLLRFGVIPMTLFAGVFFPVDSLPALARWLAYASPLWHGVELCRAATLGTPTAWGPGGHVAYLLGWCGVGLWLARYRYRKRLVG